MLRQVEEKAKTSVPKIKVLLDEATPSTSKVIDKSKGANKVNRKPTAKNIGKRTRQTKEKGNPTCKKIKTEPTCSKNVGRPKTAIINKKPKMESKKTWACPGCGEIYKEPIIEDWIECEGCNEWWHEECTSHVGSGEFICDLCQD